MKIGLSEHFNYQKLIRFTIPTIVMMVFTSIYGVVDGLFVSNVTGSIAFAAVNLIMPYIMILGAVGFMIGTGGSALVSVQLGMKQQKRANEYFSMLMYLLMVAGLLLAMFGAVTMRPVTLLLGADENMVEYCVLYGRVSMIGLPFFILQNSFQSFMVVAEKPHMGLGVSIAAGFTNMVLDFVFVYVFRLGVIGAALATGMSQAVGALVPLVYFMRKNTSQLQFVRTKLSWRVIAKACTNGSSEMITNLSMSVVNMLYNLQLMKYAGANGVVAYGVIMYVGFIFAGTYIGYSVGSAPLVGYQYGAKNTAELQNLFKRSIKLILVASVIMTLCAEALSGILAGIFVSYDVELLAMTRNAIRLFSLSYFISGFNIYASSFFTALNNGVVSALISFLRTFVFLVAGIYIVPIFLGLNGIWLAVVFAEGLSLVISIACIVCNRRKYQYY